MAYSQNYSYNDGSATDKKIKQMITILVRWARESWDKPHYYGDMGKIGSPMGETLAYDASCPVEAKPNVRIAVDAATFDGVYPECHSHYDLFNHGLPLSGKAADLGYGLVNYTVTKTSNGDVRITR
ncbi:MAG: hypothetical protein NC453_24105 [Muribaculum sp.]|nr:hypothetical protein [Muribaculum sp.]